jgi:uncharacterized phiE125 gp8 family phage protein
MKGEYRTTGLTVATPPAAMPVLVEAARRNSRYDTTDEDTRFTELIAAATDYVQKQTDTALITQTLAWKMDKFPSCSKWLYLPVWPVQSVSSITYKDQDNATQTISSGSIVLRSQANGRGRIALADWAAWPACRDTPDCVTIQFVAGFGSTTANVPDAFKQAILLLVSHWFENREAVLVGVGSKEVEFSVQSLIETLRDPDDGWGFDLE